uniref:RanBP2-type domain-containing protein n=1 Tax=Ditylenchus dipsaci TaxID=166011 RepID=A0A915DCJ1_9BILA
MKNTSASATCAPSVFQEMRAIDVITALAVGMALSTISLLAFLVFKWHVRNRAKKAEKLKQSAERAISSSNKVEGQAQGALLILSVFNHLGSEENKGKNLLIDAHVVGEMMKLLKTRSENQTAFEAENPELERIICQLEKREIFEKKMAVLNQGNDKANEGMNAPEAASRTRNRAKKAEKLKQSAERAISSSNKVEGQAQGALLILSVSIIWAVKKTRERSNLLIDAHVVGEMNCFDLALLCFMTRIPNSQTNGSAFSPVDNPNQISMEALLQTHNDLILAIHKSFNDSYSDINRNIANLTDELRQVKTYINQVVSDRSMKDELKAWREHTEHIFKMQDDRHQREVDLLVDLFKKMPGMQAPAPAPIPAQAYAQPPQFPFCSPEQMQQMQFLQAYQEQLNLLAQQHHQQLPMQQQQQKQFNSTSVGAPGNVQAQQQQLYKPAPVNSHMQQPSHAIAPAPEYAHPTPVAAINPVKADNTKNEGIFGAKATPAAPAPNKTLSSGMFGSQKDATPAASSFVAASSKPALPKVEFVKSSGGLEHLMPKPGSWSCPGCMVNNSAELTTCPCCKAPKPGSAPITTTPAQKPASSLPSATTAEPAKQAAAAKPPVLQPQQPLQPNATNSPAAPSFGQSVFGQSNQNQKSLFGGSTQASKPAAPSVFGKFSPAATPSPGTNSPAVSTPAETQATTTKSSLFGGGTSKNDVGASFASLANKSSGSSFLNSSGNATGKSPFAGDPKNFQVFQSKPADKSDSKNKGDDSDNETEEFVPDAHFEPVVPLPELVETKTGEEDENVVFVGRCKLYRFDKETKEIKERGVGEIKLLNHKQTGRYRCIMRRDQVHKVCANFPIHPNFKITQKEHMPTAYTWACRDYSEETVNGTDEVLLARFKDAQIAKEFSDKVNQAASGVAVSSLQPNPPAPVKPAGGFFGVATSSTSSNNNSAGASQTAAATPPAQPNNFNTVRQSEQNASKNKSALEKEYEREGGGYGDEYDDEEDEDEEEEQLLAEEACNVLVSDEFVSPMKKAGSSEVSRRCSAKIYDSNGVIRVSFMTTDDDTELFAHYIYMGSKINEKGVGWLEYRALDCGSSAAKRLELRFDDAEAAKRYKLHFENGIKMADEMNFNEEDDQA